MPCEPSRCSGCAVRATGLCGAFDAERIAALSGIARRRSAPVEQVLAWAGDPAMNCATLVSGALKVVRNLPDGRQHIVGLLFPGDLVGNPFAARAGETIVVLADAELCVYPRAPLAALLDSHPAAVHVLLRAALGALTEARRWMLTLGRRSAGERVAGLLLDMAARGGGERFDLPLSRGGMAEALGLTIETVSRQMTALKAAGIIALPSSRGVELLDRERLRQRAG